MISIRGAAGVVCALWLAASPVVAQPMVAQPVVAQPAAAPVDPERLALAEQIYALMGQQSLGAVTRALKTMLSASLQTQNAKDAPRAQAIQAALGDSIDDMMPKIIHATARIMAQDFSASELRGMLAFYQSPTGQAVLAKMPQITQQSMQMSASLLPSFMQKFETDYCGRVTCTPQEQQAFAQINARFAQNAAAAGAASR